MVSLQPKMAWNPIMEMTKTRVLTATDTLAVNPLSNVPHDLLSEYTEDTSKSQLSKSHPRVENLSTPIQIKLEPHDPELPDPMAQPGSSRTEYFEDLSLKQEPSNFRWSGSMSCTGELENQQIPVSQLGGTDTVGGNNLTRLKLEPGASTETFASHRSTKKEDKEGNLCCDDEKSSSPCPGNAPMPVALFEHHPDSRMGEYESLKTSCRARTVQGEEESPTTTEPTISHIAERDDDLVAHSRPRAAVEKQHKCLHCEYSSSYKSNLVVHLRTHTGEKPHKCSNCGYSSSDKSNLVSHLRTHSGEKPHKCTHCEFSCCRKADLGIHLRTHTGEKPYKCSLCGFSCSRKSNLAAHFRTHTGEKSHKCPYCDYRSAVKTNVARHVRTHTGEKPYECTYCEYSSSQKTNLADHLGTHSGEKPHKCSHCEFRFSHKANLIDNLRTHTGEKQHKCSHCEYSSSRKTNLVAHIRMHTAEKPQQC